MLHLFVNGEGGLTTAGYGLGAALLAAGILAGLSLADRGGKRGFAVRQLAYCAMAVALAYVTSFIRVFKLPYGGSVTLLSMLFIVLVGQLVRRSHGHPGGLCLWHFAIFTRAVLPVAVPGLL